MKIRFVPLNLWPTQGTIENINNALAEVFGGGNAPSVVKIDAFDASDVAVISELVVTEEDARRIYSYYFDEPEEKNPLFQVIDIKWPDPLGPIKLPKDNGIIEY